MLRHIAETVLPGAQIGIGQRDTVDPNDTGLCAQEAKDDIHQQVVLPEPVGPRMPTVVFASIVRVTSRSAGL